MTNAEFTAALGHVLKRPTVLPTPVPALKLVYGAELVDLLLVEGQRVVPDGSRRPATSSPSPTSTARSRRPAAAGDGCASRLSR